VSELHSNIGWKYTRHFHAEVSKNAADEPENTCGHTRLTQASAILRASLKWSLLIKILALSILGMSIVFRCLIQSHLEPWHASSSGAEPNGSRTQSPLHQFSNQPPQRTLLSVGSLPDKCGNVSVSRQRTTGTRHYQNRVVVEVRKRNDVFASPGVTKCSAKASGSGWLASSGLSCSTNSNGRPAEAVVIGGVSQRKAEKGASANSPIKNARKTGSSRQRRKTSEKLTGRFYRSTLITRPCGCCSLRCDHILLPSTATFAGNAGCRSTSAPTAILFISSTNGKPICGFWR